MNLLRSELRKVMSTKTWIWLLVASVALSSLVTWALWYSATRGPSNGDIGLTDPQSIKNVLGAVGASKSYVFALIIGVVASTSEFRFGTVVPTFLATPVREKVVLTKMLALGIIGGFLGLVTLAVAESLGLVLILTGEHAPVTLADITGAALGTLLAFVLAAIIGVSFGALVRNQVLGVVLTIVWILILEGVVTLVLVLIHWTSVAKFLPSAAVTSLVSVGTNGAGGDGGIDTTSLQPWAAALVLVGYAVLFAAGAFVVTLRRDVN